MLYAERVEMIMQQFQLKSIVKIAELTKLLEVSVDTIRRDLKNMEEKGLLKCVRGGACLPDTMVQFPDFKGREIVNIDLKRQAAQKALGYIKEGDIITLNSGTTNTILAQGLVKLSMKCTIITNNMAIVSILISNPYIRVIVLGGYLDHSEKSVYGVQCEQELQAYYPDISFLSINAVHPEKGFTDFRFYEMNIMNLMAKNSKQTFAIMDSSKLDKISKKSIFPVNQIDTLIMDDQISASDKKRYLEYGISIV